MIPVDTPAGRTEARHQPTSVAHRPV